MIERSKNIIYATSLFFAKMYWRTVRPRTQGARILLVAYNHILLVRHRRGKYYNLPGGGIGRNENPAAGSLRELREETGIHILNTDYLLGTYENNREGKKDIIFIFVKKISECLPLRKAFELDEAGWFSLGSLPENISPATRARIVEFLAGERNLYKNWSTSD